MFLSQYITANKSALIPGRLLISVSRAHRKNTIYDVNRDGANSAFLILCLCFTGQHRGRVRAYGRGRGHVQGVPYPPEKPEDPGCRRGDHPPESRHQARDLVRSDHQLLDRRSVLQDRRGKGGF